MHASTDPACPLTVLAWRLTDRPLSDLWWRYFELGGNHLGPALAGYLGGTAQWTTREHNVLAHVLNESLWDARCPSLAPYRETDQARTETRGSPRGR